MDGWYLGKGIVVPACLKTKKMSLLTFYKTHKWSKRLLCCRELQFDNGHRDFFCFYCLQLFHLFDSFNVPCAQLQSHQRWLQLQDQHLSQQEEGGVKEKVIWVLSPSSTPVEIFQVTQRSSTGQTIKCEWSFIIAWSDGWLARRKDAFGSVPTASSVCSLWEWWKCSRKHSGWTLEFINLQMFSLLQAAYPGCPWGGPCPWLSQRAGGEGACSSTWKDQREGTKRLVFLQKLDFLLM